MFALVLSGISCSGLLGEDEYFYPFQSDKDGKWGLISDKGNVLADGEFQNVPTNVMNGRFFVENVDGLWEIYKANENLETVGEEYKDIIEFIGNVTPAVKKGEHITLIDRDGNVKATLDKAEGKNIIRCRRFESGYAIITTEDGLSGAINMNGEVVISPKFAVLIPVAKGKFLAIKEKDIDVEKNEFVISFVDTKGKNVSDLKIGTGQKYVNLNPEASDFEHSRLAVSTKIDDQEHWGYVSFDKEVLLKPSSKIKYLGQIKGDDFIFSDGNNYGVRNIKGDVILRPKYDNLDWVTDELLVCSKSDGEYDLINLKGEVLTQESYQRILPIQFGGNLPAQISDNSWTFISHKGQEVSSKDMPDIFNLWLNRKLSDIESDFVDYDGILNKLKIEKESLSGFKISATPLQIVQAYNTLYRSIPTERVEDGHLMGTTPEDNRGCDRLELTWNTPGGIYYRTKVYYNGYLTQSNYYDYDVAWSNDKPTYVQSEIKFSDGGEKVGQLFKKIVAKVKAFGSVYKQNSGAVMVKVSDNLGYVVGRKTRRVMVTLINDSNYFRQYDISEFASENEQTESFEVAEEEATDYLEADSAIAEVPTEL